MKSQPSIICLLLLWVTSGLFGQVANHNIAKGNTAYKQQQYDKAIGYYQKAIRQSPGNLVASFNMGNAMYRDKKYVDAVKVFDESATHETDKLGQSRFYYNKGVSMTAQKQIPQSIEAYKQSLRLNPADTLARENLQRALRELQQQQPQNEQKKKEQKEKKEEKPKPNPSKLNQQQVQQLLKALEEQEKKLQEQMMRKTPVPGQPDKDW